MHTTEQAAPLKPPAAYRASALPACTRCKTALDDAPSLSPSTGEAVCRTCFQREAIGGASRVLETEGTLDVVDERRCSKCGGIASAEDAIVHEKRVAQFVGVMPVTDSRVQNGAETVFRCGSCGDQFALFNRVRVLRMVWGAFGASFMGFIIGVMILGASNGAWFGWWGFYAAPPAMLLLGLHPLFRDIVTRLRHPAVVASRSLGA